MSSDDLNFFRELHIEPADIRRPIPHDWTEQDKRTATAIKTELESEREMSENRRQLVEDQAVIIDEMEETVKLWKWAAAIGWGLAILAGALMVWGR